jgi:hypothetical protein
MKMRERNGISTLRFILLAGVWGVVGLGPGIAGAQQATAQQTASPALAAPIVAEHGPNTAEQQAKPYVILVSLDGFRYDYPRIYDSPNLDALGEPARPRG